MLTKITNVLKFLVHSLMAHNKSDVDKILSPFVKAQSKLAAVEARAKTIEAKLRDQARSISAQADAWAAQGQQAAAASAQMDVMLGKKGA